MQGTQAQASLNCSPTPRGPPSDPLTARSTERHPRTPPSYKSGRCSAAGDPRGVPRSIYSTQGEPDDVLLVACGSRRAARCHSCASRYRRDAFHLVAAGLRGSKGIPDSVESHPKVFATFTAPSFGAVHVRRVRGRKALPCRPRDKARVCPHGVRVGCSVRHAERDPAIGTPLCSECLDYEG